MPTSPAISTCFGAGDLIEETVVLPAGDVRVLRPGDPEALLTEEAFEREDLLPYWAELWASSLALARTLAVRPLRRARLLELGCGLGLAAIAAARAGARVTATDWSAPAVRLAARNAEANGVDLETLRCSWQSPAPLAARAPWPLVTASDVLYDRANIPLLLDLLPKLTDGGSEVLIADPGRPPAEEFLDRAAERWRVSSEPAPGSPQVLLHRLARRDP